MLHLWVALAGRCRVFPAERVQRKAGEIDYTKRQHIGAFAMRRPPPTVDELRFRPIR